jgi:leucyl aminopeptidase
MPITFDVTKQHHRVGTEAVVVPACQGQPIDHDIEALLRCSGFEGRPGQVATLPGHGPGATLIVVGLGPSGDLDVAAIRRAAAVAGRAASSHPRMVTHLLDALPSDAEPARRHAAAQALVEGTVLGTYRFDRFKRAAEPRALTEVEVVAAGGKPLRRAVELGVRTAAAVALARDLVNEPGGSLTPPALADTVTELAAREGLVVRVDGEDELAGRGFGGLLGVNRGSAQPPRFITLAYEPEPAGSKPSRARRVPHLGLVGKGITFDSGGLSIKTADGMMTMKDDMAGAAAVIGAMSALPAIAPRCRVTAYLPVTDNMSGPDATRPGDVVRIYGGTTVEVLNTDAEGRLVLADALVAACEDGPDAIVDLATLTGAAVVALGSRAAGLMGNHEGWVEQVRSAGARVGELLWPLPLIDSYRKQLDSEIADLRNISRGRDAGAIIAGLFLREFITDAIPWAHLDIAGPAWSDDDEAELTKGGTGFGVFALIELVRSFRRPG